MGGPSWRICRMGHAYLQADMGWAAKLPVVGHKTLSSSQPPSSFVGHSARHSDLTLFLVAGKPSPLHLLRQPLTRMNQTEQERDHP